MKTAFLLARIAACFYYDRPAQENAAPVPPVPKAVDFAPFAPSTMANWNKSSGYTIVSGRGLRR